MFRIVDHDRFQKISAGIQSWLVSIALVIGGGWTLYVFNSQFQAENARAQLAKLERELLEPAKLELEIIVQPLNPSTSSNHHYFECQFSVKNVGSKNTVLTFDLDSVKLFRVGFDGQGQARWEAIQTPWIPSYLKQEQTRIAELSAFASSTNHVSWVIDVQAPGVYAISVDVFRKPSEVAELIAAGAARDIPKNWSTERYFVVQ